KAKPGLAYNRHITGYVAGTDFIQSIEVIRNGSVIHTINPEKAELDFTFDDAESIHKVAFPAKEEIPAFVYYYLRIVQKNGHIAWSSPIWVDVQEAPPAPPKKAKKKA
ncbi:MAG: DUF3604 domain-containing protein, partial [Verrucomicrobia bacterium]|nr:DUF3604 domain-containing protein [Verrucomicrobiota bacterium]